jgi:hypothetical protein
MTFQLLTKTAAAAAGGALCSVLICSAAHAQSWLPDRDYTEGPGIQVGRLELHPGVAARAGYDTNVFKGDGEPGGAPIEGSAMFAVTPHLNLTTEGQQRRTQGEERGSEARPAIAFKLGASSTYNYYLEADAPKNVDVDASAWLGILPGRPVNLEVSAEAVRSTRPFTQKPPEADENAPRKERDRAYGNDRISPRLRVNFGSASQVLTGYTSYSPGITIFEGDSFSYLSSLTHLVEAGSAWKFLPSTALLYDARLGLNRYNDTTRTDAVVRYGDSNSFSTRLGTNGAITNTLSLRVMAGYAAGFYEDVVMEEFEDVVGEAGLTWRFAPSHSFDLGYTRDVQLSAVGGWMRTDRARAGVKLLFAGRFALGLDGSYGYATYGRALNRDGDNLGTGTDGDERFDHRIEAALRGEYRATNWLAFMADATYQGVFTDFEYAVGSAPPDPGGFEAFQVFGGVRAHY